MEKYSSQKSEKTPQEDLQKYIDIVNERYIQKNITPEKLKEASRKAQERIMNGETFQGYEYSDPNQKGLMALSELPDEMGKRITGHGIENKSGREEGWREYQAIHALIDILSNGELKGDYANLGNGPHVSTGVFKNAPFILLSYPDQALVMDSDDGKQKINSLRTVLVNGQYEDMIKDFRKAFPWISFRKADEITEDIFKKEPEAFKSWIDKIQEEQSKK